MKSILAGFLLLLSHAPMVCFCQDQSGTPDKIADFPAGLLNKISAKTAALDQQLTQQTQKYLQRLARQEAKLQKKISKVDSNAAKNLFASNPGQQYAAYSQRLRTDSVYEPKKFSGQYMPYADSLQGTLSFLQKNQQFLSNPNINSPELQRSISQLRQLQAKMQDAQGIQQYIQERKQQIKQYLLQYAHLPPGVSSIYANYNQEQYYYTAQVNAYKEALNDPGKMFQKALGILDQLPSFQSFMKSNSLLSTLFPIPGNYGTPLALAGLQTRDNIAQTMQSQLSGPNAQTALSQNFGDAQSQLSQLKDRLLSYGQGGGNVDIPDFQPNGQKIKTFFKRLEFGTNIQTLPSSTYFPTTTDLGLSLGYKINDKNMVGVGASYNVGWGSDISHMSFSSQGFGLRSFVDIQVKKSLYATGGLEYNYQQPFYSTQIFRNLGDWQQSGLIGVSKIISMNTKVFKKTKVQFLWDFLSYRQVPQTQPFIFRVGYSF